MRKASFIEIEIYHIGLATAGVRLLFFSGGLRGLWRCSNGGFDSLLHAKTARRIGRAGYSQISTQAQVAA
jgi:hypothetical protein